MCMSQQDWPHSPMSWCTAPSHGQKISTETFIPIRLCHEVVTLLRLRSPSYLPMISLSLLEKWKKCRSKYIIHLSLIFISQSRWCVQSSVKHCNAYLSIKYIQIYIHRRLYWPQSKKKKIAQCVYALFMPFKICTECKAESADTSPPPHQDV